MAAVLGDEALAILKHGAVADAIHDFSHKMTFNKSGTHDNNKAGLPELKKGLADILGKNFPTADGDDKWKDEDQFMEMILGSMENMFPGDELIDDAEKPYMYNFVENIKAKIVANEDINLNITYGAEEDMSYDVKYLNLETPDGGHLWDAKKIMKHMSIDKYIEFFGGESTINILTDAQCINILELFRKADPVEGSVLKVNKIINRELFNDPATKKYKAKQDAESTSINEDFLWDSENNTVMYPASPPILNEANTIHRNSFFSNFNFALSPLSRNTGGEFIKKPDVSLVVTNPLDKGWKIEKNNPNKQNTILSCVRRIHERFGKIGVNPCEISAEFQCKRSGDWLQALSCLDTGRSYISANNDGQNASCDGQPITLVTLDRVLLAYALFMGIDVIFTWIQSESKDGDVVEEEEDEDENEDDEEEEEEEAISAESPGGRPRVVLYFKRSRDVNFAERVEQLYKFLLVKLEGGKFDKINAYVAQYNGWLESIRIRATNEINHLLTCITADADLNRTNPKNCNDLLKAYWRYTSIDYNGAKLDSSKIAALIKQIGTPKKGLSDEKAKEIITAINSLSSKIDSFNNIMKNMVDENSILNANSAYLTDPVYTHMVGLLIERLGRGTEEAAKLNVLETVGKFHAAPFGLPSDMFGTMITSLDDYYKKFAKNGKELPILKIFIDHAKFLHPESKVKKAIIEASAELGVETVLKNEKSNKRLETLAEVETDDLEAGLEQITEVKAAFLAAIDKGITIQNFKKFYRALDKAVDRYIHILANEEENMMFLDMIDELASIDLDALKGENLEEYIELITPLLQEDAYVATTEGIIAHRLGHLEKEIGEKREGLSELQGQRAAALADNDGAVTKTINEQIYTLLSEMRHMGVALRELRDLSEEGVNLDAFEKAYAIKMRKETDVYRGIVTPAWLVRVDKCIVERVEPAATAALNVIKVEIEESALSDEEKEELKEYIDDSIACIPLVAAAGAKAKAKLVANLTDMNEKATVVASTPWPAFTKNLKLAVRTILDPETYYNGLCWTLRYMRGAQVPEELESYEEDVEEANAEAVDADADEAHDDETVYEVFSMSGAKQNKFNKPGGDNLWTQKDMYDRHKDKVDSACASKNQPFYLDGKKRVYICPATVGGASTSAKSSQLFYIMFLRQLMNTLDNFENGTDCNYLICECVARLAISLCGTTVDMVNTEALFYDYLANGDWLKTDYKKFIKGSKFASEVSDFARGEALETMNLLYSSTPIPRLNAHVAVVPGQAPAIYSMLKTSVKGRLLSDRVKFLRGILYNLINMNDGDNINIGGYSVGEPVYNAQAIYGAYKALGPLNKEKALTMFPKLPVSVQKELKALQNANRRITFKKPGVNARNLRQTVSASIGGVIKRNRKTRRL